MNVKEFTENDVRTCKNSVETNFALAKYQLYVNEIERI
jgi:hypothetical protein